MSHSSRANLGIAACLLLVALSCRPVPPDLPDPDRLASQVVIRRDTYGIPHILASTEEAAAFAFGYAQAEDHAAEIGRRYIAARGQAALVFGASGIENDLDMAQFDNVEQARRGLAELSPLFRRVITAYAAGVNRYVSRHRERLPQWMPEISAADVLANSRASAANNLAGPALPRQLRQKYEGQSGTPADAEDDPWTDKPGSNAFALSGARTTTGKPILLGNPHLAWSSLYWEAHVRVPGKIDFYGSTLVGIPVLRAGFNDRLGFVTTNNAPDLVDVFGLHIDPNNSDRYIFDGKAHQLQKRDVTIQVRNDDGTLRTERRAFQTTPLGPVIHRDSRRAFVVKSTALEATRYFEGFYMLSRTRTLRDWLRVARENLVPTSNFTYADADGNILYLWNGRVPQRVDGRDYRLDVDASGRRDIWNRLHDVDDLPRLLNPPGGYIQNANNPPQFVSLRDPIDMSRFPSYFERGPLALRPQLALQMLDGQSRFSVADVIRLKYSPRMLLADRVKPHLIRAVRASASASEDARAGADVLEGWDNTVSASSRGSFLFQQFWDSYSGAVRQPFATPWTERSPATTPEGLSDPAAAIQHLESAVRTTRLEFGSERVAWGEANRFRFGDLDLPGDGASGTYGCFRVLRFDRVPGAGLRLAGNVAAGQPLVGFGDAWVILVDFSGPVTGWSVLAYGQTSNLESPHSRDQIRIFAEHRLRRAWYSEAEIKGNLSREYRLE
jgi:acyl-homoserine-lactone acylase